VQVISIILKSLLYSAIAVTISYFLRVSLITDSYLSDVGGLGAFTTSFGTLYGITTAFVVFEVWGQFNNTVSLVDKEAHSLERLFRLTLYFKDKRLKEEMRSKIREYINLIVKEKFQALGSGERSAATAHAFRQISSVIRSIKSEGTHDSVVFTQIVDHYGKLHDIRSDRVNQSLARLPKLLKTFLYISSFLAMGTLTIMPFANWYYQVFSVGGLTFIITMIFQVVEDLDNPFKGYWNITTEPFQKSLKHIEEDYES
jgi:hypothetical protein